MSEPVDPGVGTRRSKSLRISTAVSTILTYTLIVVCALIPVPYIIEMPGPVFNTLGSRDGQEILSITGTKTYPTSGQLDMLTVGVAGGPGRKLYPAQTLWSVVRKRDTVIPSEAYYPLATTRTQVSAENQAQMASSQDTAVAAALNYLGKPYKTQLGIGQVVSGSPAQGKLEAGDVVTSLNGSPISGSADDIARMQKVVAAGKPVTLDFTRGGSSQSATVTPRDAGDGAKLGVVLSPTYDFPIDVTFRVADVGGPSAGLIFALTVIDKLEPGDMTGGVKIAGTGAISDTGVVSPIGGARQKVAAAAAAGNEYFLSPADNCAEVLEADKGLGMKVVRVDTLESAVQSIDAIANKSTDNLPSCATAG